MKTGYYLIACVIVLGMVSMACGVSTTSSDPFLWQTEVALSVLQTDLAKQNEQSDPPPPSETPPDAPVQPTYTLYPTFTQRPTDEPTQVPPTVQPPPQSTATFTATATSTFTPTVTVTPTDNVLFQRITVNRTVFHCVPQDGPTKLTITVEMSDVNRGATLFWRLEEKANNNTTDWKPVVMQRAGGNARTYTFDANTWAGTNNFYYPALMRESWFEYQIISNDGRVRTEVFTNVTFFPCGQ